MAIPDDTPGSAVRALRLEAIAPGLYRWSAYSPAHKVELTSHAFVVDGRIFCFDPIPLAEIEFDRLSRLGQPAAIVLTNENHERDAVAWRERWQVSIHASTEARLSIPLVERLPAESVEWRGWQVQSMTGGGGGELAFRMADRSLVVLGDAVVHLRGRGLELLPEKYCCDRRLLESKLRLLTTEPFERAVMAHGDPILRGASAELARLLPGAIEPGR